MSFMEPEVWQGEAWEFETNIGTERVQTDVCDIDETELPDDEDECNERMAVVFRDYLEGTEIRSANRVSGWFAKLSASGFMDQTDDLGPFETEAEAHAAILESYGTEDGEPEDWENDSILECLKAGMPQSQFIADECGFLESCDGSELKGAHWIRQEFDFETREWKPVQGNPVTFYDDGSGPLWIYRDAGGLTALVRCKDSEQTAYDIVCDSILKPIEESELPDAYGIFDHLREAGWHPKEITRERQSLKLKAIGNRCTRFGHKYPELVEGYRYQSNATGTGIVSTDLNGESLEKATDAELKRLEIAIVIGA